MMRNPEQVAQLGHDAVRHALRPDVGWRPAPLPTYRWSFVDWAVVLGYPAAIVAGVLFHILGGAL